LLHLGQVQRITPFEEVDAQLVEAGESIVSWVLDGDEVWSSCDIRDEGTCDAAFRAASVEEEVNEGVYSTKSIVEPSGASKK
jgi:hypothetical protein